MPPVRPSTTRKVRARPLPSITKLLPPLNMRRSYRFSSLPNADLSDGFKFAVDADDTLEQTFLPRHSNEVIKFHWLGAEQFHHFAHVRPVHVSGAGDFGGLKWAIISCVFDKSPTEPGAAADDTPPSWFLGLREPSGVSHR
jgi:hypothetical protein